MFLAPKGVFDQTLAHFSSLPCRSMEETRVASSIVCPKTVHALPHCMHHAVQTKLCHIYGVYCGRPSSLMAAWGGFLVCLRYILIKSLNHHMLVKLWSHSLLALGQSMHRRQAVTWCQNSTLNSLGRALRISCRRECICCICCNWNTTTLSTKMYRCSSLQHHFEAKYETPLHCAPRIWYSDNCGCMWCKV